MPRATTVMAGLIALPPGFLIWQALGLIVTDSHEMAVSQERGRQPGHIESIVMLKMRFVVVAVAAVALASCSKQVAPTQPGPVADAQAVSPQELPFAVPEGAVFVARTSGATNIYRIQATCGPLHSMTGNRMVFFWTLEAGVRAGYRLSKEEGCA